jgi:hypothetical protein
VRCGFGEAWGAGGGGRRERWQDVCLAAVSHGRHSLIYLMVPECVCAKV